MPVVLWLSLLPAAPAAAPLSWQVQDTNSQPTGQVVRVSLVVGDFKGELAATCRLHEDGVVRHELRPILLGAGEVDLLEVQNTRDLAVTCTFTGRDLRDAAGVAYAGGRFPEIAIRFSPAARSLAADRAGITLAPVPDPSDSMLLSAGAVPDLVVDSLELLASIAYDRAKSRAYAIVGDRVETWVCDEARFPSAAGTAPTLRLGGVYTLDALPAGEPLLPGTCGTLRSLDSVVAWANNADTVARSVAGDLYALVTAALTDWGRWELPGGDGLSSAWVDRHLDFLVRTAASTLRDEVLDGGEPSVEDARVALAALVVHPWQEGAVSVTDQQVGPLLDAVFAIAGPCLADPAACDEVALARGLAAPWRVYAGEVADLSGESWWPAVSQRLPAVVGAMREIVAATEQDGVAAQRAFISLGFELAELVLDVVANAPAEVRGLVHGAREVYAALVQGDHVRATTAALATVTSLFEADPTPDGLKTLRGTLLRAAPVVAVLAANARSLEEAAANPEEAEALREARKEALEAVIDASTNRDGREGETIVSLGANVGVVPLSLSVEDGELGYTAGHFPVTLPMGVAVQHLGRAPAHRPAGARPASFVAGYHLQLSPVDLALFLPEASSGAGDVTEDLQWSDFLMFGGQAGVAFYRPQDVFTLAADVRYTPFEDDADLRVALVLSYYVPFFDLN